MPDLRDRSSASSNVGSPSARLSFDREVAGRAPACSRWSPTAWSNSRSSPPMSSTSSSRHVVAPAVMDEAVTWSSQTSAIGWPAESSSRWTRRWLRTLAAGTSSASRQCSTSRSRSDAGIEVGESPIGSWISTRSPGARSNLTCHPSSSPPSRRRSVMPARSNRRSAVSKYSASRSCSTGSATDATPSTESRPVTTTRSSTSNLVSISV